MIWLTGTNGMLGKHIAEKLKIADIPQISTDLDLDITDETAVTDFCSKNRFNWIINCSAYTAVA